MRSRSPYVLVGVAVAVGVLAFLIGLFYFRTSDPLPPQEDAGTLGESSFDEAQTTTTTEPEVAIGDALEAADVRTLPSAARPLTAGCETPVPVVAPAADFAAVGAAAEPGTCFMLEAGEFTFHDVVPKDWMTFVGAGREATIVKGSASTENAFHGTATGVSIGRLTLNGFQGDGGEKRQEQGAIRGTSALWASDRGAMATEWLIEDVDASDNFASGVFLGDNFTIRGSKFSRNGVTGLGGSELVGGLIEGNIVDGNGAQQATGALGNGGGMKFTQAGSAENPVVVRGNEIFGNSGIGVWCDIACNGFEVFDNYIHDQESRAVMFELSSNAVIRGNILINTNTWSDFSQDFNAGAITVGESSDVLIENNYIDGAVAGIIVRQTNRPVRPEESFLDEYEGVTYVSQRVEIRSNVIVNAEAMGISTGSTGKGLIPDPSTIRFDGNTYDDPGGIKFHWANGEQYSHSDWVASGRDVGAEAQVPAQPAWSLSS